MQLANLEDQVPFFCLLAAIGGFFYMAMPTEVSLKAAKEPPKESNFPKLEKVKAPLAFHLNRDPYFPTPGELGRPKQVTKRLEDVELEAGPIKKKELSVDGIFIDQKSRWAYIDGRLRKQGESFSGTKLEKVFRNKVILKQGDRTVELRLKTPRVYHQ